MNSADFANLSALMNIVTATLMACCAVTTWLTNRDSGEWRSWLTLAVLFLILAEVSV